MSDLSDVQNALVNVISGIAYPNGVAAASITGVPVRIYAGWPIPLQLDADLKAGICHISVYPRPEESNTTRYDNTWHPATLNVATLTLAIQGQTVLVGGAIPPLGNPHNLVVVANGVPVIYAAQPSDSLLSIAAGLAALLAVNIPGTSSSGAVVTLPANAVLTAVRVGVTGTVMKEIRRQERLIQIGIWADSPAHRDAISQPIDLDLAARTFLSMPDTSAARLRYKGSPVTDVYEKSTIFRRDLLYDVEYGTFDTQVSTQITAIGLTVSTPALPTPILTENF